MTFVYDFYFHAYFNLQRYFQFCPVISSPRSQDLNNTGRRKRGTSRSILYSLYTRVRIFNDPGWIFTVVITKEYPDFGETPTACFDQDIIIFVDLRVRHNINTHFLDNTLLHGVVGH